jgi:hypothetical protein
METELQQFQYVKKYLEKLGYPPESILFKYSTVSGRHTDLVVKVGEKILVAIEVKSPRSININSLEEIEYHPLSRKLQKEAQELEAKFYVLFNGKDNLWMQTGEGGRPEKISEVSYNSFNLSTPSESQYINGLLNNVVGFLKNFPLTGDHLFDTSIVFYTKLAQETKQDIDLSEFLKDIFSKNYLSEKQTSKYLPKDIVLQAIERLESISFCENKLAIVEFIDLFFESNRREWNVPRWLGDLMVKILNSDSEDHIIDLFTRNGIITSAAYLNGLKNLTSYYSNQNEIYWIKIQQLLALGKESNIKFEPALLGGQTDILMENSVDGVLMAPPFNLKFQNSPNSILYNNGVKDSTSVFLEMALKTIKPNGKVVAIVLDNFLVSAQFIKARKYLAKESIIETIISLPSETFKPFSAVKTSIISFIKKTNTNRSHSFLASIEDVPKGTIIDCSKSPLINETLQNFYSFLNHSEFKISKSGFIVEALDTKNFHFSKYWFQNKYNDQGNLQDGYLSVPLKELIYEISRGGAMVSDSERGDIPYISPASIRSLRLIKEELSYTTRSKIPTRTKKVENGEVVINAIGPHRGNAAFVTSDFDGMPINRHIIALKANTNLITPEYLAIVLNSKFVQEQFFDKSTGTVIPSLNLKSFEEILIPVPNLYIQKKIASEFISLTSQYNSAQEKLFFIQNELNNKLNHLGKEGKNI